MIYTPLEYSEKFLCKGKKVSPKTIMRRCENGFLPSTHHARKLPAGDWIIEVADEAPPEIIITKVSPAKPDVRTINRKYFNFK
jgi:hypothetical protein